jgi:hypothetical protein
MKLPDQGHIIPPDIFIGGNQRHFFGKGGCDKQTVKGVTMYQRQAFKGGEMSGLDGEFGKAQFAYVNLDCHFPGGNYAQVYGVSYEHKLVEHR